MQPDIQKKEQVQENLLRALLFKYLAYWKLFLVLLIIALTGAFIYLKFKVPVYELKATLIIKDEQKGADDSKMIESLDVFNSKKIVENEIEVIKSKTLAQQVVRNLHLYAPVNEEGSFTDHSAYNTSPVQIIAQNPDSLQPVKKAYFTFQSTTQKIILNTKSYPVDQWNKTPYGTLKFIPNPNYKPVANHEPLYFSLVPVDYVADDIVAGLDVEEANKLSTVVNISWKDEIPARGKAILNNLINVYNQAAITEKNTLAANTLSFVEDRLRYVTRDLDSVEGNLQHFKTKNNIVDIDAQGKLFLQNVGQNDQKIGDISMQLAVLDQVENYVSGKGGKGGIVPSTFGITDPVLSNLLNKLYDTELQYEKLKKIVPENNPMLVSLTDQINKIKPGILENIESQRKGLIAGKNDLAATNNKYSSMLNTMPGKERELLEISRQQAIKNNIYTFLLEKREEAAIAYASAVSDSRLVDSAQASKAPVSPNKMLVGIIAIIAAFGSGIGYVSVKETFNTNINSRAEIESYTHVPILGELVQNDSKDGVVMNEDNHSLIAEQFRQLRTMLAYLGINRQQKKILITSSISAEGKSFVVVNLGMSLALTNKKVVLVDLDLRRPALAFLLCVTGSDGIAEYLNGDREIEDIIKRTETNKNLFVIPCNSIPPNPSELLLNGKVEELFIYLESVFDYIIIDTSPIAPVTDASILSPLCDATLYVIRQNVTPRLFVQKLDEHATMRNLKNVGIVFNGIQSRRFGDKYGDGYKYGYSYLENRRSSTKKRKSRNSV